MQPTSRRERAAEEWLGMILIGMELFIMGFAALLFWYGSTHLVVTRARPGQVAPSATNIVFWFNKPISTEVAKDFSMSPNVPGTATVKGNALIFSPSQLLADDRTYTATISHAVSADGRFSAGKFSTVFKIGFVPYDQQSKEVQQRGLEFTDNRPPSLAYLGEDELLDEGVTSEQIPYIEAFLKRTFDRTLKTDYAINIDNVAAAPFDSNQSHPISAYTFDVEINDAMYSAVLDSAPLGDIHIRLYNTAGKLVDDSGVITPV